MTKLSFKNIEEYRDYVKKRISEVAPLLQKAAVGDFSSKIEVPEEEDEFSELLVGLKLMLEDLKVLEEERKKSEEERKGREEERKERLEELEKWKNMMTQRELKMIELKKELETLRKKTGEGSK